MELALAIVASCWLLLVPGLPVAAFLAGQSLSRWEVFAVAAPLSLGANYFLLQVLNRVGIKPPLVVWAIVLTVASAAAMWHLHRMGRFRLRPVDLRYGWVLIPGALTAVMLWSAAYSGFGLLAPNQDAYNHNLWISRIMSQGSVLGLDVQVVSPLQPQADGIPSFYPLAWHAGVATAASLFSVTAPTMSLVSTVFAWSIVLPLALIALARRLTDHGNLVGLVAGTLAQTVPLVPGVPISWGAMATIIGVALLPAGLLAVIHFFAAPGMRSASLLGLTGLSLFFTHSPEAATLLVIFGTAAVFLFVTRQLERRTTWILAGLAVTAAVGLLILGPKIRSTWGTLNDLLGSNERSINESIGSFLTLSINVPSEQLVFGLLVLAGVWLAAKMVHGPWLAIAVAATLAVYLVSGASVQPIVRLRPLTVPWYGSYERTAWVAVPFLVLLAALPISFLLLQARLRGTSRFLALGVASALLVAQAWQGGWSTMLILRKGVAENQIAGPGSRQVFDRAERLASGSRLILSEKGDGSAYAYMYNGLAVSNGPYDVDGNPNQQLDSVLKGMRDLCSVPNLGAILAQYQVSGILLGTREYGGWPPPWTELEIRQLSGAEIISRSTDLFLIKPDPSLCP